MWFDIHSIYLPFMRYFRRKRMRLFVDVFDIRKETTILDIGGTEFNWQFVPQNPDVVCLNLDTFSGTRPNVRYEVGDARALGFANGQFDVAFSNSVIEHVGGWADQEAFARELRRVARKYYVQTPYRWSIFEPHYLMPFIHFFPKRVQYALARNFTVWGLVTRPSPQAARDFVDATRLLTFAEMRRLFPDATILAEKFLFMPKSIIAIRVADRDGAVGRSGANGSG